LGFVSGKNDFAAAAASAAASISLRPRVKFGEEVETLKQQDEDEEDGEDKEETKFNKKLSRNQLETCEGDRRNYYRQS